jgi:two-component system phosphate regulon sensor histidine kinase PhoR
MAQQRIITDPTIANGSPVIKRAQVPVHQILSYVATGMSFQEIIETVPELGLGDVKAALDYAATQMRQGMPAPTGNQGSNRDLAFEQPSNMLDLNKILVVDDSQLNLDFMEAIFAGGEFILVTALDGREGLAKARAEAPFLILTDIMMPGMSGLKLCQEIKADPLTKDASVIFITAHGQNTTLVAKGLNMGADEFISRPFEPEELLARVQAVARLKRAELDAQRHAQIVARHNQSLELLNELAIAITSSLDLQKVFASAMQQLSRLLKAEAVSILLLDGEEKKLTVNIASHLGEYISVPVEVKPTPEMADVIQQERIPAIISSILHNPQINLTVKPPADQDAVVCVPMVSKEQTIGTIALINKQGSSFTAGDWALLNSAVNIITVAIENARLFTEVQEFNRHLEQKVAERTGELITEKKKVEAILVSMADGVLVLDDENCISTVNTAAQKMLGADSSKLLGMPITSKRLATPLWDTIRKLASSIEVIASASVDVPDATRPGGLLSIQARSAKVHTETGQTIGTVIVLSDVTSLMEVERMKARFITGVTHELKTPLAVIKLHSNNLANYHTRLPELKRNQLIQAIQEQVQLLGKLVEDILELSRLDSGLVEIERQPISLRQVVAQVVAEMQPLAAEKEITLRWQKSSPEILIQADKDKINRLITNLIDNAIKYTPAKGSVEVKIASELVDGQKMVLFQVCDTGIGIPLGERAQIFERFYRIDPSHTIPGTGLGLSIVKEIVTAHGGKVTVNSPPEGGSMFTVSLPEA